jgi:hypothetical protein
MKHTYLMINTTVILKFASWDGKTVAVLYFLGLMSPGVVMDYLGSVIFGLVNLNLYVIYYIINGKTWSNEIIGEK